MNRNLITRMGVASGLVAAIIAALFLAMGQDPSHAGLLSTIGVIASTALILALTWYLTRYIIVPLRSVRVAATAMAAGDLTARVPEEGDAEPVEVARAFNTMAASLERTLTELAAEKRRVEVFQRAGEQMAAALRLDALAEVIVRELGDAVGADVGALWAYGGEDEWLRLRSTRGVDPLDLPDVLTPGTGVAGRALARRERVTDLDQLAVPLALGGGVLGVLSLGRLDATPFEEDELKTLTRLAEQASVALANVVSFARAVRQAEVNRAVLDAVPDPIGLLGNDGSVVAQNAPMAKLREQDVELDLPTISDTALRDELVLASRTYSRYAAPAGPGRIVVLRDVTSERQSERLKDEFFALVSHELRTPLTSIIGYLELVLEDEDDLPEEVRGFLEVVDRNAKRLLRLVGDMLFVAQVEAGRLSLERRDVDLARVVEESAAAARPAAQRAGVALVVEAATGGPAIVFGDPDRLGQLVDNLVSNAVKFTPRDGEVSVGLAGDATAVELAVRDTGMGIPSAEQDQLFQRFFRSSTATLKAVPGVGLGLTIVKTIAEAHGGSVALESAEGEGTTVKVRLPR